jgi:hypothetical protein
LFGKNPKAEVILRYYQNEPTMKLYLSISAKAPEKWTFHRLDSDALEK